MLKDVFSKFYGKLEWGLLFAEKSNYNFGYFDSEKELVDKYLKKPSNVLIVGSGNGREAKPIAGRKHKIFCFDNVLMYLEAGKILCEKDSIEDVNFIQADVSSLPFKENCFDFIFHSMYGKFASKRIEILSNMRKMLKEESYILITTQAGIYSELYSRKSNRRLLEDWIPIESKDQIIAEVEQCGFKLVETKKGIKRPEYIFSILQAVSK